MNILLIRLRLIPYSWCYIRCVHIAPETCHDAWILVVVCDLDGCCWKVTHLWSHIEELQRGPLSFILDGLLLITKRSTILYGFVYKPKFSSYGVTSNSAGDALEICCDWDEGEAMMPKKKLVWSNGYFNPTSNLSAPRPRPYLRVKTNKI